MGKVKTAKRLAVGAAVAGAAGYVAGLLTAPASGSKTRKQLKKDAESSLSDVEQQLKILQDELGDLVSDAREQSDKLSDRAQKKFGGALDEAKSAKDKLQEVLKAASKGGADDSDLQRALKDAKHAVDHLKDFLTK